MGWTQKQRAWMRQVMSVSGITNEDYHAQIKQLTGKDSSTDESLTNADFEAVMCHLEIEICKAIADQIVTPDEVLSKISDPWSFHRRRLQNTAGSSGWKRKTTSEGTQKDTPTRSQLALIGACRKDLQAYSQEWADWSFIQSIIHQGCFGPAPASPEGLTCHQASQLINALKDKLSRYESSGAMRNSTGVGAILANAELRNDPVPF